MLVASLPVLYKYMNITTLGSGSSGNGYVIQNEHEALIIECGMPYKDAVKALKNDVSKVAGCLVTHSHGDHAGFIQQYAKAFNVYATQGTLEERRIKPNTFHYCAIPLLREFKVGNFVVKAFDTEHDTAEPCGFIVCHEKMGTMLFLTDTHHVRYRFDFPINYIFIECNHTNELVDKSVKNRIIPRSVGVRAKATHMSLERCINCLKACDTSQTKAIVLIHISANNGNAQVFREQVEREMGKPVYCAAKGFKLEFFT